jgi:alpha-ketoglutarate-dependent taurine dioxygenase
MNLAAQARLDVVRLSPHIGAEIRSIDLRETLDPETVRAIHRAWLDHGVVLFRDQDLSQENLLRVTGYFGDIGNLARLAKFFPKGYSRLDLEYPREWRDDRRAPGRRDDVSS